MKRGGPLSSSEKLFYSIRKNEDGTEEIIGYGYGDGWVEQAMLMDDLLFDTPEEAKEWWKKNYGS